MDKKTFKYENKNNKLLRVKDLLMLFSIFALCIISIVYAGTKANENIESKNAMPVSENSNNAVPDTSSDQTEISSDADKESLQSDASLEPIFIVPVNGAVIKPYSRHELIYSETMDDWRIHNGIDIECPYGTNVFSAESGRVKSISHDINLGNVVIVESGDFELIYASLSADIAVTEGQTLKKGDLIGKTSDSCMMEICDEPHIHFEMKRSGEYVDPLQYVHYQ